MKKGNGFRIMSFVLVLVVLLSALISCVPKSAPTPSVAQTPTQTTQNPGPSSTPNSSAPSSAPAQIAAVPAPAGIKATTNNVEYLEAVPMTKLITAKKNTVRTTKPVKILLITWGGDVATIYANGGKITQPGSTFAQKGLSIELSREDNPLMMVEKVINGETPYFRGTNDQIQGALEAFQDRGIEMVVIYQETWSTGGDTIVVRSDKIKTVADLRGKTIGLQRYGPHVLYLATVLKGAGLTLNDVSIKWLRELTIPPYDSKGVAVDPMTAMQRDPNLDAVLVISPDMVALTAPHSKCGKDGNPPCDVGGGQESSIKGAKLLLSTKTAAAVIADVYAVRKDYFDANRQEVQSFVSGLLMAQEAIVDLFNNRSSRQSEYQNLLKISADILRDNPQATADIEGLLMDCTFVGFRGNVQFFTGEGALRTFDVLTKEAQDALLAYGLLTKRVQMTQANWDYAALSQGLRDTAGVAIPKQRFDPVKVEQFAQTKGAQEGVLFEFPINFGPNQNVFSADSYRNEFDRVLNLAATYPGAIVLVEGHADPSKYLELLQEKQKAGSNSTSVDLRINQTKQAAKNLSVQRANAVRDSLIAYAKTRNLTLDTSQFTVVGAGIDRPKFPNPRNEQEWLANMRVVFQIIQAEAELDKFTPAGK